MRITVFGAGYVALVPATCLAGLGNNVMVLDLDPSRTEHLQSDVIPIDESGL
jgi:UDPglucose 6-dehydrogenase